MKKVIYVISEHFAPISMISSNRFTKIIKHLVKKGKYEIYVFTRRENLKEDAVLKNECSSLEKHGVKIIRVDAGRHFYSQSGLRWMAYWYWHVAMDRLVGSDYRTYYEENKATKRFVKNAIKAINEQNIPRPEVIISTYGEMGGHSLALELKERVFKNVYWIADYRDPIYYGVDIPKLRNEYQKFSDLVEAKADKLVMISDNLATSMGLKETSKIEVITNGFDSEEYDDALSDDVLRFSFSGSYYVADMKFLFKAIRDLISEGKIEKNRIEINYSGSYGKLYSTHLNDYGLEECLNYWGDLSRKQSIQIQNMSDVVLLLSRCKHDYEVIPGKMSGSFGCNKPILCFTGGDKTGSEIARRIEELHYGYVFEEPNNNVEEEKLKSILIKFYNEKQTNHKISWSINTEKQLEYEYKTLAAKYDKIITEAIEK